MRSNGPFTLPLGSALAFLLGLSGCLSGDPPRWPATDMASLVYARDSTSAQVSSYDRTGGNLDRVYPIQPGEEKVIAELEGPGVITHIWTDINPMPNEPQVEDGALRKIVLRMYWEGGQEPSVEVPYGDFFLGAYGRRYVVQSAAFTVSPTDGRARNCWFHMPFRRGARITLENGCHSPIGIYFIVDYERHRQLPEGALYFHAQYRQAYPCADGEPYTILEAAGRGHFVGCMLAVVNRTPGWWGEGDHKITIDGREESPLEKPLGGRGAGARAPTFWGTGTEDYFCQAFGNPQFLSPYFGSPLGMEKGLASGGLTVAYRFHINDPIVFHESFRFELEHGASGFENRRSGGNNHYSSVAYWYQTLPHAPFPRLPPADERMPPPPGPPVLRAGGRLEAEDALAVAGDAEPVGLQEGGQYSGGAQLFYTPTEVGRSLSLPFVLVEAGEYGFRARVPLSWDYGIFDVYLDDARLLSGLDLFKPEVEFKVIDLGTIRLSAGQHCLRFVVVGGNEKRLPQHRSLFYLGVDYIECSAAGEHK